jgi:hypothetical protein
MYEMPGADQEGRFSRADRRRSRRRHIVLTVAALLASTVILAATTPGLALASPAAAATIEGVWSFNGGQIAIRPAANGTLEGRVVAETKFAECTHPVDQRIWSEIRPQANGSYFGLHQWYFEVSSCPLNPTLGPTAFRVLEASGGVRYLRVCLSSPGGSQPTITADGGSNGATYGCVDSARVGALPSSQVLSLKQLVSLPSARKCVSRRAFAVHVRDPAHDPFKTISISIAGHRLNVVRHGVFNVAMVNLKGLPRGTFTLEVRGRTVLGRRLSGQRSYHTCVKRRVSRTRSRRR